MNSAARVSFSLLLGAAVSVCRGPSQAEEPGGGHILRSVVFEGRESIPAETLLEVAGIEPGSPWRPAAAAEARERLSSWPYIESVSEPRVTQEPDGSVTVVFSIKERVLLGRVELDGNSFFRTEVLLPEIDLKPGQIYREEALRSAEKKVISSYQREGFLFAFAEAVAGPPERGRRDILLRVSEGRRVTVSEISLDGADQVPASQALSALRLQPRRLFGLISRGYYEPDAMEPDLDRLRAFYAARGYLSAQVDFRGIEFDSQMRSARVRLQVKEGPRSKVTAVRVLGSKLFPARLLVETAAVPTGTHFSQEEVEKGHQRLVRWYEEHSDNLPVIEAKLLWRTEEEKEVLFVIREEERHEVGLVEIRGNRITRDRVVRQEVTLVPGSPFLPTEVRRTQERLMKRGLFESIEISATDRIDPERPSTTITDIAIDVKEKDIMTPLLELTGGVGASSGAGEVLYFGVHRPNFDLFRLPRAWNDWKEAFRGGGQYLGVDFMPGTKESQYAFQFLEPYFFRSDFALRLDGSVDLLDRREYEESHLRGLAELEKFFDADHRVSASLGFVADQVKIHDLEQNAPPDVVAAEGRTFLAYPRLEVRYDGRDRDPYSGPRGLLVSARFDLAEKSFGSEVEFARARASAEYFLGLFDDRPDYRHVLHAGASLLWAEGRGGDEVPFFERFYLGGPRSFRGFDYRELGPHQGTTPVGGEGGIYGTVDYSFPLIVRELRAFGIFDWGDLEPSFSEISTGRFRTAAGGGLMVRSKIMGQFLWATLYWVQALSSEPGDEEQLFSFSLGMPL